MPASSHLSLFLLFGLTVAAQAADAPHRLCLDKAEQRAALASHRAISLGRAIRSVRRHHKKIEVLSARLCRRSGGLVYELTLLAHNGKVTREAVDAANGKLMKDR